MPQVSDSEGFEDDSYFKIARLSGATYANPDFFSVFIPNRNKRKELIKDHSKWVENFKELITRINRGTSSSLKSGTWLEDDNGITYEDSTVVESYIFDEEAFFDNFPKIVTEMRRFGKETEQSSVAFIYNGMFFTIEKYE